MPNGKKKVKSKKVKILKEKWEGGLATPTSLKWEEGHGQSVHA
jgi:hypothetical protein